MPFANELVSQNAGPEVLSILGSYTALAAAGTTQATATAIASPNVSVTSGSAFAGVILPAGKQQGDSCTVSNRLAVNICVYPPVGGDMNGQTNNVPLVMAPNSARMFVCMGDPDWSVDSI